MALILNKITFVLSTLLGWYALVGVVPDLLMISVVYIYKCFFLNSLTFYCKFFFILQLV